MTMRAKIFNVTESQDDKLRELAKKTGLSRSLYVRRALEEYLAKQVKPKRNQVSGASQ
jgi:predicted DNA-binding protein